MISTWPPFWINLHEINNTSRLSVFVEGFWILKSKKEKEKMKQTPLFFFLLWKLHAHLFKPNTLINNWIFFITSKVLFHALVILLVRICTLWQSCNSVLLSHFFRVLVNSCKQEEQRSDLIGSLAFNSVTFVWLFAVTPFGPSPSHPDTDVSLWRQGKTHACNGPAL